MEAIVDCCAEKTYAATTIADIVSHASISRTTFYKRFGGKRECFDGALDWCVEEVRAAAAASHSPTDAPAVAVRKGAARILELMAAKPALTQLLMGEAVSVEPAVIERYRKLVIPPLEKLWADAGEPRKGRTDPRLAFGRAQVLIYNQITTGQAERLPELLPEIVYLALLPFSGHEAALSQARRAGDATDAELSADR
ncbi:MAG: helix-turn-helix domain-containing protein [Solirubrobacterales bacterium]